MVGILIIVGIVGLYITLTVVNGRVEIPKDCQDIERENCSSCHSQGCSIKKAGD